MCDVGAMEKVTTQKVDKINKEHFVKSKEPQILYIQRIQLLEIESY